MKKLLLLFFLLTAVNFSQAQDCNCAEQFTFAKEKITINYSGYKDKVTSENQAEYEAYTKRYTQLTTDTQVDTTCFRLVYEWTRWFKDGHIQMGIKPGEPEEIRAQFVDWETINMTEAEVKTKLAASNYDPIEGIWESDGGAYRCAILKMKNEKRDYAGFILKGDSVWWMPGQVKFELKNDEVANEFSMNYFMQNHSIRRPKAKLKEHILYVDKLGSWRKVYPEKASPKTEKPEQNSIYNLSQIDDKTLLLVIPTMNHNYRKEMRKLVKKYEQQISSTPNLVIDCRNNGGGSDFTYFPLRRFIYTNPIVDYYGQTYCTEDNVQMMYDLSKEESFNFLMRWYFKRQYKKQSKHIGEYYGKTGTFERKYRWKKHAYPQNIAVLINGGCGSSCESFAYMCNQSKKVTLMGQNTSGVSDYGNLHTILFPNKRWELHYATTRNTAVDDGKGIDNIGIPPHVRLDDSTEDWVEFAKDYLKGK